MRQAEKTTAMLVLAALGMAVVATSVARAEANIFAGTIPAQTIVCVSPQKARDYKLYSQKAPDFTHNLIAKADCFKTEEPMEALFTEDGDGFVKAKVLSGHNVWLPASAVMKKNGKDK